MGCANIVRPSEKKHSVEIARRIIPKIVRSETLGSNFTNNGTYSRLNSGQNQVCLNIKILPQSHKIISNNLNLSGTQLYMASFEYVPDFNYIRESYANFSAALSYFRNLVHETCFKNFVITDGIFIMLVSLKANPKCNAKYLSKPPYIELEGTPHEDSMNIFSSWKNLMQAVETILRNNEAKLSKCAKRLEIFSSLLNDNSEFSLRPGRIEKAIRLCNLAIEVSQSLVVQAQDIKQITHDFFASIKRKKKDIEKQANKAVEQGIFSGERIVHSIFAN
ncbi:hypothetical protein SteCoe_13003 [Stentor coeruleus]|uniref:Uncharacterized protein n=1 Tax=Stentor coeruleus TaxID=5963 RepID=A0A1R2C9I3_9CILI|nr:hypothetical protein SteCoe_13003 [Stentor coeruleus]